MAQVKQHTIRMPSDLYDQLAMRALCQGRSLNKEIIMILKDRMKQQVEADAAAIATVPQTTSP